MASRMSIGRLFSHFATTKSDEPALVAGDGSEQITWAELHRRTNRLARAYAAAGVAKDDTVAIALPNCAEFFCACVAAWKLGGTVMPLSHKFPEAERRRVLDLARPALLVGSEAVEGLATLPAGFVPDPGLGDGELPDVVPTYWKALTSGGSTGKPKLIVSHDDPHYDPESPDVDYMHADGVHLVCGPLYHNAAFIYSARGLFSGNRLVIMPRFDPGLALDLIERHRVTWLQMVPTHMNRLRRLPEERLAGADVSSVRTLVHVGGPCPPRLKLEFIDWLGPDRVVEIYAGTESQGVTRITGREWLEHRGSVGRAIRGSRFEVQDEEGRVVPPGVVGEVFLMPAGGPGSTYHYIGAEPRGRKGWESLGDLGWYDEDGYLYLADRSTDCIVSGGANIYPAEVEGALESHPRVRACAVVGLPDDDLGQRTVALVEAVGDRPPPPADELDEYLRPLLAAYKRPRAYEFVDRPLRDEAGKVRRSALRADRLPGGPADGRLVLPSRDRWRDLRTGSAAVDRLLRVLDVDRVGERTFVGLSMDRPTHRVFGGQLLAQAAVAAARTAPGDVALHSLHGYFARVGDPAAPIRYEVTTLRAGRSFHLQRVDARQGEEIIGTVTCSMQRGEPDHLAHQVPEQGSSTPPEDAPARYPFAERASDDGTPAGPVELREGPQGAPPGPLAPSEVWLRVPTGLPDDPLLHRVLVVYMSDYTILRAAFRGHAVPRETTSGASLDHAVWLHRSGRADRWVHYVSTSPSAGAARALGSGSMFSEDGRLVATSAQEMVIRFRSGPPAARGTEATAGTEAVSVATGRTGRAGESAHA
ncbi:acyl-CoA thioesterase II [Actinomadura meyerae]|uniref:Acyl-CoA thioesterase II n=1 Tax=Actinomadura meyerae TaxID=240840 RepID=A0A239NUE5_9ACTN|nr:AMP-binding protein [Actinomadura meyerae]SNT58541.1 acyl-CoA thioesterase II [Actinomadura meyerae]